MQVFIAVCFGLLFIQELATHGIWKVAGFLLVIAFYLFALLSIVSALAATFAALVSWNRPRLVFGRVFTPEMGRPYVKRALLIAGNATLLTLLFHLLIAPQTFNQFVFTALFAYSIPGTIEELSEWFEEATCPPAPAPEAEREMIDVTPREEPPPFRFASWDDEAGQ